MRGESIWNAIGALVVILPLLYFAFRSPWLVAVGAVPSALSVLIVMAAYAWLGIPLSAAAAGAVGHAVRARHRRRGAAVRRLPPRRHASSPTTAGEDLTGPASSMLLGMWTTAATFYGLAVVDFPSLEELGLLIGHSMMVCGVLTLVLVPALLPATPPAVAAAHHRLAAAARRPPRAALILGAAAVITVAAAIAAPRLRIDPSLDRLRADVAGRGVRGRGDDALRRAARRLPGRRSRARRSSRCSKPTSGWSRRWRARRRASPGTRRRRCCRRRGRRHAAAARIAAAGHRAGPRRGPISQPRRPRPGSGPAPSIRFAATLPALLDTRARVTYDGFVAHGLGDLLDRSIVQRDGSVDAW